MIRSIALSLFVLISFGSLAVASEVQVKGSATLKFESGLFSSSPDAEMKRQAIEDAKLSAWKRYTAGFNAAKLRSYQSRENEFLQSLDDYVLDYRIIDEVVDKDDNSYTAVIRMSINGAAVDAKLSASSVAGSQMGGGSYFSFIFLARETEERRQFLDKETRIATSEQRDAAKDSIASAGGTTVASSTQKSASKTETGGSTVKKADKVSYRAASSSDIDAAMSEQLTVSGFEVVDYGDVVSACGGPEPSVIASEFSTSDSLSRQARNGAIGGARDCDVRFFAVGTMDVGLNDVDPVSGLQRVTVSVRGQVWDIAARLPRKVASVGPVQFAGLGPDPMVARRNALLLAGEQAGTIIVDQMNMKNLH